MMKDFKDKALEFIALIRVRPVSMAAFAAVCALAGAIFL